MKRKPGKFRLFPKLERLEVYLLAADNPIGKRQLRLIFRRKRSKEVLTREQVTAIKRGRRVLRREMKEQGLKRRIDFEVTATNLGLYFDRNRLLGPIFLWFLKGNTALKILATTAVLTTVVTVTQTVVEYVTQFVNQYVNHYVTEYLDKDRLSITVSDEMLNRGFELSETPDFASPQERLFAILLTEVPCVSITSIPHNVDAIPNGTQKDFFTYTFYCRYIDKEAEQNPSANLEQYATDYKWGLRIHAEGINTANAEAWNGTAEGVKVSDAIWVMVIQDGEVILCAKEELDENGEATVPVLPTDQVLETRRVAFRDHSIAYINAGLARIDPKLNVDNISSLETLYSTQSQIDAVQARIDAYFDAEGIQSLMRLILQTENWRDHYNLVSESTDGDYSYYQVEAEKFHSVEDNIVVERTRTGMLPWIEGTNEEYHKYTVVIWLEGDDPQCTNALMGGYIGMNFQILGKDEVYVEAVVSPTESVQP